MEQDLIARLCLDTSPAGNKLRYEHMYGLIKLICQVYGYDNLPLRTKQALSYVVQNCEKHPVVMLSFLFMALHLEHSIADYFAPPEPGRNAPIELRQQYRAVMDKITQDLRTYPDGRIRGDTRRELLKLPDAVRPKVPPGKLSGFRMTVLPKLVAEYESGTEGCKLTDFVDKCASSWLNAGTSWKA
jgi:hypothetical protein